jgi:hypothetical protein
MQTAFTKVKALLLSTFSLALAFSGLSTGSAEDDPKHTLPNKEKPATVVEMKAKLKAGIFKLTEADVVKMLGQPIGVKRPGDAKSELEMHWEYATYIFATFHEGKLSELTGGFSEHLPVDRVTLANFKGLTIGMTEAEVVKVLGEGNGTAKVGTTVTRSWGRNARLSVSFNAKGLVCRTGSRENNAVSIPSEIQLPVFGPIKP